MTKPTIEFFYDILSPYTYLAATQIDAIGERTGLPVRWRPFALSGSPRDPTPWFHWVSADIQRWARFYGVPFQIPKFFPMRTLAVMRALIAAPESELPALTRRVLDAAWVEGRDPSDPEVLASLIGRPLVEAAALPEVRQRLRANSDELAARGGFGTPTFLIGDELFFGNDRLWFVERAALGRGVAAGARAET
jgi:2-hydroxychromene-2-carboxylate isomerase